MNIELIQQLILRASTSPVTSNFDKHLMLKAAQEIEALQASIKQAQQERDHWNNRAVSTPWEIR